MPKWEWMHPAVWGIYLVVVLEFLFMISPFALHFYSAYRPALSAINSSPLTAWMTGFFLPHFSETTSTIINQLVPTGFLLAKVGLVVFLIGIFRFIKVGRELARITEDRSPPRSSY